MSLNGDEILLEKINNDSGRVDWFELRYLYASGRVLLVSPVLDLVRVASAMAEDDSVRVREWMDAGLIRSVEDRQAKRWFDERKTLRFSAVQPWALVQDFSDK